MTDEESLKAAIANGAEIVLGSNITLTAGIEIPSGTTVTIDLGGHTLTGAGYDFAIRALEGSALTVKNGTIAVGYYAEDYRDSWGVDNKGGRVIIEGVVFKSDIGWGSGYAVTADSGESGSYGTTTLRGATIVDSGFESAAISYGEPGNQLIIEDGTYDGYITAAGGSVIINGGTIKQMEIAEENVQQPTINGGDFTQMVRIRGGWIIPEGSNVNVVLNNAMLINGFSIYGGKLSGTINADLRNMDMTIGSGVEIDDNFIDYINSYVYRNKRLVWDESTESYVTETCEAINVYVESADISICRVDIVRGFNIGNTTHSRRENVIVSPSAYVTMDAQMQNENYVFDGWYDSEGRLINKNNPATIQVNASTTYYARYTDSDEVVEFQNAANEWLYENGTDLKESYTIKDKDDMSYLAYAVNSLDVNFSGKTVTLTANLEYTDADEYTPIGDSNTAFAGTFDGGDHTISGINLIDYNQYAGIFGHSTGTIKNLNATDCHIQGSNGTTYGWVGIIAGEGRNIENCTVTDCTVGGAFAGLIAGHSNNLTVSNVTVEDCRINHAWKSGAIVGYVAGTCNITGAEITGLDYQDSEGWGAGSLVGHLNSQTSALTGINVNAQNYPLIGTAYSGSNKTVNFNGEDNNINSSVLINDLRDSVGNIKIGGGTYTLSDMVNEEDFAVTENMFNISGGTFNMDEDVYYKYLAPDYYTIPLEGGGYQVVSGGTLFMELAQHEDDPAAYDIVINAADTKTINRLTAAQFAFEFDTQDAIAWEIEGAENISVSAETIEGKTVYLFNFKGDVAGDADVPDSGEKIAQVTLGTVKFTGVGTGTFGVDSEYTGHAVHATTDKDNIVDTYIPNGGTGLGKLILPDPIELDLQPETSQLTVNVTFPNEIKNNPVAYQKMWAEITGGTLTETKVINFGQGNSDVTFDEDTCTYSFTCDDLIKDRTYTVAIKGEGYRTARYAVEMTEDKILSFWNNVKDAGNATVIETGADDSTAVVKNYLAGDIVMNNVIDIYDLSAVVAYFGEVNLNSADDDAKYSYAKYDLNRDGKIDSKDVAMVLVSWGK